MAVSGIDLGKYKLGWSDREDYVYKPKKGVNETSSATSRTRRASRSG